MDRRQAIRGLSLAAFVVCALSTRIATTRAAELRVPTAEFATIQRALDLASEGDTILLAPGEYILVETLAFNRRVTPQGLVTGAHKNITLRSTQGPERTTIRVREPTSPEFHRVLDLGGAEARETTIQGITFTGAPSSRASGGSVLISGPAAPHFVDCTFADGSAAQGGGVTCTGSAAPRFESCVFLDNSANIGGGLSCEGTTSAEFVDCEFTGNTARSIGGAVWIEPGATPVFTRCRLRDNSAPIGGAVEIRTLNGARFESCTFEGNTANNGGAVAVPRRASQLVVVDCAFVGNRAANEGGALWVDQDPALEITGCRFEGNGAGEGAAIFLRGSPTVSMSDSVLSGNVAATPTGSIVAFDRPRMLSVTHCTIAGNFGTALDSLTTSDYSLRDSIVWANSGTFGDLVRRSGVTFSCVETEEVLPGEGNVRAAPRFCGWLRGDEPLPVADQQALDEALSGFSHAIAADSPCAGAASDGGNMGAAQETCPVGMTETPRLSLGPGEFALAPDALTQPIELTGAGREATTLRGGVVLRVDTLLADMTLEGGLASVSPSTHVVERCDIRDGGASGVTCTGGSRLVLEECTITGNRGAVGGGLSVTGGSPVLRRCVIVANTALRDGGGVACEGGSTVTLEACELRNNSAPDGRGGGLACGFQSTVRMSDCVIEENGARIGGGLAFSEDAGSVVERCRMAANGALDGGGGLVASFGATPRLIECRIDGNGSGRGGGVLCTSDARVDLDRCVIAGNSADIGGGGVASLDGGSALLLNCHLFGNAGGLYGGGVLCSLGGTASLSNCTVGDNFGGGITGTLTSRPIELLNSVVFRNTGTAVSGPIAAEFSCIETSEPLAGRGNINADPLFLGAGDYDFLRFRDLSVDGLELALPVFVTRPPLHTLRDGSPAIDAGSLDGAPGEDILGVSRPCGDGVDMGAFEAGDCPGAPVFRRGDADNDGTVAINDPVTVLGFLFRGAAPPTCPDAADADDSGRLDLIDATSVLEFLFRTGAPPAAPGPNACGRDLTADGLLCAGQPLCE